MKTKIIFLFIFILVSGYVYAQSNTVKASIKVYGNCAMCKRRIETALDTKGIKAATWNTKTKQLEVVYQSDKITEKRIHEIVSSVGHDTDQMKAKDDVYANLPFCCLYRDHDHSGMKDN
jgi:periplasmic mercuric ion binding protein